MKTKKQKPTYEELVLGIKDYLENINETNNKK